MTGLPKTVILSPDEVRDAHRGAGRRHRRLGRQVPRQAPPELAQDIIIQGIHLVGGGGMLRGLDRRLAEETALPVHLVDAPLECVVLGAGRVSRVLRPAEGHVHGCGPLAQRSCPSGRGPRRPGAPASPGRPARRSSGGARPPGRRTGQERAPPAGAPPACRRWRPGRRASPAGSPMAPSAATAASRHSASSGARSRFTRAADGPFPSMSFPQRHARGLGDQCIGILQGLHHATRRPPAHGDTDIAGPPPHRRVRIAQAHLDIVRPQAAHPGQGAEGGGARTEGARSPRAARAVASSPAWPATAAERRRATSPGDASSSSGPESPVAIGSSVAGPDGRRPAGGAVGLEARCWPTGPLSPISGRAGCSRRSRRRRRPRWRPGSCPGSR